MQYLNTPTSKITMINSSNNNNLHHQNRRTKRITKRQELSSPSLTLKTQYVPSLFITDARPNEQGTRPNDQQSQTLMKNPFSWTKKWTKWFTLCGSERVTDVNLNNSKTKLNTVS